MPATLPTGLVTILYADVEKSSQGYQSNDETLYDSALDRLHDTARSLSEANRGIYVWHSGDGFYSAFSSPLDAVKCAVSLQESTQVANWPSELPVLRIRIGIHTDSLAIKGDGYRGFGLWRAHRLMDAANGRQILLSGAAYELCRQSLESNPVITATPLGSCRLRDLLAPEQLYRIDAPGIDLSLVPPRMLPEGRHNFPVEERPFVGRTSELEAVRAKFMRDGAQLVTISGFGGIGKTRLALTAAAGIVEAFPDGAWLVELDSVTNGDSILTAISMALQLDTGRESQQNSLIASLKSKKILLVLDCFEKLVEDANVVEGLLSRLPDLKCLVTSRRPLRLAREHEFELKPMGTNDVGRGKGSSDGVALFVEAARHTLHDFELSAKTRVIVHQICQELEGIPLAIVLAASRLRSSSLEELLVQAQKSRIGAARVRTSRDDRHSSLPRVIDDSLQLLAAEEQRLLMQLNVFAGGFYRDDAIAVCAEDIEVNEGIDALRDHSLIQVQTIGDRNRFKLLDTVREYLQHRVTNMELDLESCRFRHATRYLDIARQIESLMEEGRWKDGSGFLWIEMGNLRAAIAFSIEMANPDLVVGYADAVGRVFVSSGLWPDFERLAAAAEAALSKQDDPSALSRLLARLGALAKQRGALDDARRLWERRLRICEDTQDKAGCADCRQDLAGLAHIRGDLEHAEALANHAADIAEGIGDERQLLAARTRQAMIALDAKDLEAAADYARSARDILESCDDKHFAMFIYPALGKVYRLLDDCVGATVILTTAMEIAREGARTFDLGYILLELSRTCEVSGKSVDAARFCMAAFKIHQSLGSRLQQEARDCLDRMTASTDPDVQYFIGRARNLSWQETLDWRDNNTEQGEGPAVESDNIRSVELRLAPTAG